ncbi:MAG: Signal peptidase-like protein [Raineya sp.]|nr:Signal peptidase-like protein [Raineya sp.]
MGCTSCLSGGCSTNISQNGCGGGCKSGSCNKMNSFDWLSNMELPADQKFNVVEVRFKNGFKAFYRNTQKFDLCTGEPVVVEATSGYHIGKVALQGELVRLQMLKKKVDENTDLPAILRLPTERDLAKWKEAQAREMPTMFRTRQIVQEMGLEMKLNDVEFQADNTKATFYYSAEGRVDFRELIKVLAAEFKIRVEMRQISLREEAGRLGGIGVCGRELCCSTWLTDFKSVNTSAARYQNLSLNPAKLSGQCGRLKCCLNYELDTYMEALKDFPTIEKPLQTQQGVVELKKTDIFRKVMWFGYENDSNWYPLSVEKVREFIEMNEKGIFPETLAQLTDEANIAQEQKRQALEQSKLVAQVLEQKLKAQEKQQLEKTDPNKQTQLKKSKSKKKRKSKR